jgi:hypothetical protein
LALCVSLSIMLGLVPGSGVVHAYTAMCCVGCAMLSFMTIASAHGKAKSSIASKLPTTMQGAEGGTVQAQSAPEVKKAA